MKKFLAVLIGLALVVWLGMSVALLVAAFVTTAVDAGPTLGFAGVLMMVIFVIVVCSMHEEWDKS